MYFLVRMSKLLTPLTFVITLLISTFCFALTIDSSLFSAVEQNAISQKQSIPDSSQISGQSLDDSRLLPVPFIDIHLPLSALIWVGGLLLISLLWILQLRWTVNNRNSALRREITLRNDQEIELQMGLDHLERTHSRLRVSIDRMPLGYIVWTEDFTVSEWNPAAERLFGWTAEEARGKHAYELVVPEEAKALVDQV